MRAYTAWVVQSGRGNDAMYITHLSGDLRWGDDPRKAIQFARRSDARKVIDELDFADGRPVEKTFG